MQTFPLELKQCAKAPRRSLRSLYYRNAKSSRAAMKSGGHSSERRPVRVFLRGDANTRRLRSRSPVNRLLHARCPLLAARYFGYGSAALESLVAKEDRELQGLTMLPLDTPRTKDSVRPMPTGLEPAPACPIDSLLPTLGPRGKAPNTPSRQTRWREQPYAC